MCKQYFLFVCFALICLTDSAPPPSFLKPCHSSDSKCLLESTKAAVSDFAKGLPEFHVPSLEPVTFKSINASQGGLLFVLTDITAVGLSKCEPKKIQQDAAKSKIFITIKCTGKLDGQYELRGRLLVIPIEGQGAVHANLRSAVVNIELDYVNKIGEDGENHWQIKSWNHKFHLEEKSDVVFENLYKDNEVLGQAARDLIANSGNEVIMEIGPPVIKAVAGRVVKNINSFFKHIPSKYLTLD